MRTESSLEIIVLEFLNVQVAPLLLEAYMPVWVLAFSTLVNTRVVALDLEISRY